MHMTTFDKPFWRYSSRNIHTRTRHPRSHFTREKALDMWAKMHCTTEIAVSLNISEQTVKSYLRRARSNGDARAYSRRRMTKKREQEADMRKRQIIAMHEGGASNKQIAAALGCTIRLVQIRIKDDDK